MADENVNGNEKQHYSQVASVLRDRLQNGGALRKDGDSALMEVLITAAKEFGIESGDQGGRKQVEKRCQHSCSDHAQTMNPKFWEGLPQELLQAVFGHLPLDAICRMQFLNKEWQRTITADSDFHRLCNKAYPTMVCFISRSQGNSHLFWVRVFDVNHAKWHSYEIVAGRPAVDWNDDNAFMDYECEDGGVVCFATLSHLSNMGLKIMTARSVCFFHVVNPLMRVSQELPPLFDMRDMKLVQISVDRRTGAFQVFVAARRCVWKTKGWIMMDEYTTLLYDSLTGEWRPSPCGFVEFSLFKRSSYDFANGQVIAIDQYSHHDMSALLAKTACYKESLFVLKRDSEGPANEELANESPYFYIEEFRWESTSWVKARNHRCNPFECPPKTHFSLMLYACKGFLVVLGRLDSYDWSKKRLAWLYDLSTNQWNVLDFPRLPGDHEAPVYESIHIVS